MSTAAAPSARLDTLPPWPGGPALGGHLTLGAEVACWMEHWLIQPNGPAAGRDFQLTDRQKRFLYWWYAIDENGRWLFHHGVRRLAKGSGKSPFAAALALAELCSPCRVYDIDHRKGIAIGRPMDMPLVQIAATSETQTGNTMRMVRAFAPKGSDVVVEHRLDPGRTKYSKVPEGTLEVITSSPTAAEGAEGSCTIADETEHWKPANGGVELASTLIDNLAKSGNRMVETANAFIPGEQCVAESTWDAWCDQEEGRTRNTSRILYDAVIAPPETDWSDPDSIRAALEAVYEDCWWIDVENQLTRIMDTRARLSESKRKYGNRPTVSEDAWVTPEQWTVLARPGVEVKAGERVALFFDGSKSRDTTALVGCRISDGHVFLVAMWEPDPGDPESVVPVEDVDAAVARAFDTWKVLGFFADVQEWESFTKVEWPRRHGRRLKVKAVPGGKSPEPIAWDMRTNESVFTKAAELCQDEILEGKFTHDGDPRLARHVANARERPNRYGTSVRKETPDSPKKIDGAVCVIGARHVRKLVVARHGDKSGRAMAV
jgi:phage terminase large subunit-like protein